MGRSNNPEHKTVAVNKQAHRLYAIDDVFEAGLVLLGSEVKSLRQGRSTLKEGYIRIEGGEAFLVNVHIPPYEQANINNHNPTRPRKLLLHRREIQKLIGAVSREGYTLVPMSIYFTKGKAKLEFGLGKGKKLHDKREDQKEADAKRDVQRALRGRSRED
jgi:SsrA-binding protein